MRPSPELDPLDARVLTLLQEGLPLVAEPFRILADRLELSQERLLERIGALKDEAKLIRQISPIYDTRKAGYDSALVAFGVQGIEAAAALVGAHPGVSHNYERSHDFNLWFTLAVPPDSALGLEGTVARMARETGAEDFAILRSKRTFKIGVRLSVDGSEGPDLASPAPAPTAECPPAPLTELQKQVIRVTQRHLPIERRPFLTQARELALSEAALLQALCELHARGVMRRFAAILHHRKAGFVANGMAVWAVAEARAEEAGRAMAGFAQVSHCYERTVARGWPYRLFSMIHGRTQDEVQQVVDAISRRTGLGEYRVLYSTREFKKKRVELFPPALHEWENARAA